MPELISINDTKSTVVDLFYIKNPNLMQDWYNVGSTFCQTLTVHWSLMISTIEQKINQHQKLK